MNAYSTVYFRGSLGHLSGAIVLANALGAKPAEFIGARRIAPQRENALGKTIDAVRLDKNSTARFCDHLGKYTVARLDHGNLVSHGLKGVNPLRLSVRAGHGKYTEAAQKVDLVHAVKHATISELVGQSPLLHFLFDAAQVTAMLRGQIPGRFERDGGKIGFAA